MQKNTTGTTGLKWVVVTIIIYATLFVKWQQ